MEELKVMLEAAGFSDIKIKDKEKSDDIIKSWNFGEGVENMVFSAYIQAKKPF
ncbi:MAG TPA: hypothetical protein VJ024_03570 [Thermodesulfovibrionales bacterium]|nr:hypothetical protein [Thermodesulfovibrionales bacterium]